MKRPSSWLLLALAVPMGMILAVAGAGRACAENLGPGGGARIIAGDQVVGPYRLLVTSSPEPAQVGIVTFAVRVSDPQSDEKERNAQVAVELTHTGSGKSLSSAATHQNAGNAIDYVAHVQMDESGVWEGVVRVDGPAGPAEVAFTQRILPPRRWSTVALIGLPFAVGLAIFGVWYAVAGPRRPSDN